MKIINVWMSNVECRIFIALLVLLVPFSGFAQPAGIAVWPNGAPNSNGITTSEVHMEDTRVANVSEAQMFVFLPKSTTPTTAVIICPGGDYTYLAMEQEGYELARWLNEQGVAAIVLKYRMPNGHPDVPLSDVQQCLRVVRWMSPTWNIDPEKIGVAGFSAGGHLASTAATQFMDSATRPDFAILFYPLISLNKNITHIESRNNLLGKNSNAEMEKRYSNELCMTPQTPPTLLFHSDDDMTVSARNSVDFYTALKQNKVPSAMYIFPAGGHAWGLSENFVYSKAWRELFIKWLKTNHFLDEKSSASSNIEALNKFVQNNQLLFTLGYIFNEYANEDLLISYTPYNSETTTMRGFAIIRNGVVYNTPFNIPEAGKRHGVMSIWNGNYVTVALGGSGNDKSTGLYGFQVNNENLSQPAVKLWQNTELKLRWLMIYPYSEKINDQYYFGGERNYSYQSSFRCNMATGEVLFTDDVQVYRTFVPVIYANGIYYGACRIGELDKFCIASSSQYYNNNMQNTHQLSVPNLTTGAPSFVFDFGKKRGVITVEVNQLYYPVSLSNGEIDMSVPGLSNIYVYKYKNKSYQIQDFRKLIETDDISYLFDDKYVKLPNSK